jgi:hypothetical protein
LESFSPDEFFCAAISFELALDWKIFNNFLHRQISGVAKPNLANWTSLELLSAVLAK